MEPVYAGAPATAGPSVIVTAPRSQQQQGQVTATPSIAQLRLLRQQRGQDLLRQQRGQDLLRQQRRQDLRQQRGQDLTASVILPSSTQHH